MYRQVAGGVTIRKTKIYILCCSTIFCFFLLSAFQQVNFLQSSWKLDRPPYSAPCFYGTQRLIIVFIEACHWILFWASWIQPKIHFILSSHLSLYVKWVPCHHGMARPQVVDVGEGLQIWRVAVNILNKQSRTADKGWPSSLGVGRG
jgi:hypothetical protein